MPGDVAGGAPRVPTPSDLARLCAALNDVGARYVVVGGMAVNYWGLPRLTQDIDLLADRSPDNVRRVKRGLDVLADRAARDVAEGDVEQYTVVGVVDELTVDLMGRIADVEFANAESVDAVVDGIPIPLATLRATAGSSGPSKDCAKRTATTWCSC